MTNQELFNKVVSHLRTQGPCLNDIGSKTCMYRGHNKTSCAAGCLIQDEHYSSKLEGWLVTSASVINALSLSGVELSQISLLSALQQVHDNHRTNTWETELSEVASHYGLKYNEK